MKQTKLKTKLSTIVITSILILSAILVAFPLVTAQQSTRKTYCFVGAVPNPVGVGQEVLFTVGIYQQLSSALMGWEGLSITIQKPDGTTDTITDIRTDSTGMTGRTYVPDQVGTFLVQAHFPEQEITETKTAPRIPIGTIMLASDSEVLELIVQEESVPEYPGQALPSEYWTRPIDAQLRSWSDVTGNWLTTDNIRPEGVPGNADAAETAHLLWVKPLTIGGVAGAPETNYPYWSFSHGDAYEGKWNSRIIIDGILIYAHRTNDRPLYYTAVDIRTGQELWKKVLLDNRTISLGQNLVWSGYNHHGVYPYFWVTKGADWYAFNPYTGDVEFTVKNVPAGTTVLDKENGWLYRINVSPDGTGYIWSMVDLIEPFGQDSPHAGSWIPAGSFYGIRPGTWDAAAVDPETGELTAEAKSAYIAEFTFDASKTPGVGTGRFSTVRGIEFGGRAQYTYEWSGKIFGLQYAPTGFGPTEINTWAISLDSGQEGTILFSKTWATPSEWQEGNLEVEFNDLSFEDGVAVIWTKDTRQYYAFSTETGEYLWGPTAISEHFMNYYGWTELLERPTFIWDGKLYSTGVGGVIYCYDVTDGSLLWEYAAHDEYNEYLFANNWWQFFLFIADGKLYSAHLEHSAIEPMPRGAPFLCLDANTGEVIFKADGLFRSTRWGGRAIIGDSVIVGMDTYDNRLYAIGKGPSKTTVSVAPKVITSGSSVVIEGSVMDVSPGTEDTKLKLRFPNGVPAVADESMSEWMLYVYKQFAKPDDVQGVRVHLTAIDPNGNFQDIGYATTDINGNFGISWTPPVPGDYHVTATFEGTKSYTPSEDSTYFAVTEAPTPAAPIEPEQPTQPEQPTEPEQPEQPTQPEQPEQPTEPEQPAEAPFITTELAIVIAVVVACILGAVSYHMLRKRK